MKKWIVTILGWALIAFAVGGLFTLAANLPAKGYELRFKELVSVLQANSLSKAAEDLGLNLALWKEESETITTDLGRSSVAQRISVYGSPTLCFPAAYLYGSAPGAEQWDGCAISVGLADALFGSREVTGLELMVDDGKRRITGVVEGKECFLICPDVTASDAGYTAASLEIKSGNNPRGTMQNLLQSAGLSENDTVLLPTGTLRQIINAVAWIPLTIAALLFLHQLWRLAPFGKMGRQVAAFALLLMAALALPDLLAALPRWLVPSRWSDMNFWMDLGNLVQQSLMAFVSLTNSIRDQLLGAQILAFGGCLLGLVFSVVLAFTLVQGLTSAISYFTFHFTLLPALVACVVLLMVAALVPVWALRQFHRGSIVEQLRIAE